MICDTIREMYNILIGICTGGTMRSETVVSLIGAMDLLKQKGIDTGLSVQIGGYVAHNRNSLVALAKEKHATHLMFIDNDMEFPPSGILRLLDSDKDIIGGAYNARGVPDKPIISTVKMSDDYSSGKYSNVEIPNGLFKCYGMGTGFMMIKMSVFQELVKPYFVAWEDEIGEHHTEDIEFCIKAIKAGFDVWCNANIKIGHIGTYVY